MTTTIKSKVIHIYELMGLLESGRELYIKDKNLQDELGIEERTLDRYLKDIHQLYENIIFTEKKRVEKNGRKVTIYRVTDKQKDISKILKFFLQESKDLSWLLQLIHEGDPTFVDDQSDKDRLEKIIKEDKNIFLFLSNPFEKFNEKQNKLFSIAKDAVKNYKYKNIINIDKTYTNAKCLKLIYSENNWYILIENKEKKIRFLRFAFIKDIQPSFHDTYQKKTIENYTNFIKNIQNPMTLNKKTTKATLKVVKSKAQYFKKGMKPFFPSQLFIRENDDGSIEFSIDYTQDMEILPFIKKWLPSILILSPSSLKETLIKDLKTALEQG